MRVAEVDITVTERSPGRQIHTDPNRNHMSELGKNFIKLRIRNVQIQIADVKRRRSQLTGVGAAIDVLALNWSLTLNNLSHLSKKDRKNNRRDETKTETLLF